MLAGAIAISITISYVDPDKNINMITKCLLNKRDNKSGRLYERVDDEHYPHDALGRGFALAELKLARHIHNLKNKEDWKEL